MGKATSLRSRRGRRYPLDILMPSGMALLFIAVILIGDLAIDADIRSNEDSFDPAPVGPEYTHIEQEVIVLDGWTDEGGTSDLDLGDLPANVTAVTAVLTWTDDVGSNDVLRLSVVHNDTEVATEEGATGGLTAETTAEGADETLTGAFGVRIVAVSCPGRVGISPIDLDDGNRWQVRVSVTIREEV